MKTKLKDTKVGKFLKEKAPKILDVIGDVLPDNGSLGIVKNLISQDPDLTPEEKAALRVSQYVNTNWDAFAYDEGETYIASKGTIGTYAGYNDWGVTTNNVLGNLPYTCKWHSNYADFDSSQLKFLKNVGLIASGGSGDILTIYWTFDFGLSESTQQTTFPVAGTIAEWGLGEWGESEWGPSTTNVQKYRVSASHSGRVVSIGFGFASDGAAIAVDEVSLFAKLGREDK